MKRWWRCMRGGHRPHVYLSPITVSDCRAIVRCDCSWGIRPQLVYVTLDNVAVVKMGATE